MIDGNVRVMTLKHVPQGETLHLRTRQLANEGFSATQSNFVPQRNDTTTCVVCICCIMAVFYVFFMAI